MQKRNNKKTLHARCGFRVTPRHIAAIDAMPTHGEKPRHSASQFLAHVYDANGTQLHHAIGDAAEALSMEPQSVYIRHAKIIRALRALNASQERDNE